MTFDQEFFIGFMVTITIIDLIALPIMFLITILKNKIHKKIEQK